MSQRLDLTATPVIAKEIGLANSTVIASSPPKMPDEPTFDVFKMHLGIGWSRISDDEDIQAAACGWAKFIENHYPVSDVHIRLQSKGLASYLVEAKEGWFLFGEDLREGRLVSASLERIFENLRSVPPVFDGEEMMLALVDTPGLEQALQAEVIVNDAVKGQHPPQEAIMNVTSDKLKSPRKPQILVHSHDIESIQVVSFSDPGYPFVTNDKVEGKQNDQTEDLLHIQVGPPTDSGYASATHEKFDHAQNLGAEDEQNLKNLESDDIGTVYSDASSLPPLKNENYISELDNDLFSKVRSKQHD
jgi:hypothetical protein